MISEVPQFPEALAEALNNFPELNLDLPDPEDEEIPDSEFENVVDIAWKVCDRFDLQTEIWRGRILRIIRDREKKGGDGRGSGFLNWLKEREIGKSQAYALIELANSADTLMDKGHLDPDSINNFSKRAFVETAKSSTEVQQMVTDAAKKGDRITRREVKQLADEWTAVSSDLLPEEIRSKATSGSMPPRYLAPLVREMEKLPDSHLNAIQEEIVQSPELDTIKQLTSDARNLSKYLDAAAKVQALNESSLDMEMVLEEALRLECLNIVADLVKQSAQLETTMAKLYSSWRRLGNLSERLFVDTGASTPHLRHLLGCLDKLSSNVIELSLNDLNNQTVRLQILSETD
ncbi:conserved hypothetical protein [Trichodesmium erythraeum IMS101]|uniref:Uncharacterized protein n=1 Tax=Trichodesmium erythraeum (strain IMS101) TaxID=203124 RepID=Q112I1_TRIEI|nr:hypothetical protein [Trichodesmium erythraeum GBRTRLIN201]MCH2049048.1 hypothetical protein [Trichodesmium sp. ALOHA_ZT_67]MDE5095093.1 hypothetical protein [Trichodesmium sp. St11_bin5]